MEQGHDREWVTGLSIQQLADLFEISYTLEARRRAQTISEIAVASQGDAKGIKKAINGWERIMKKARRSRGGDLKAFIARMGGAQE